jgi:5'-AMP-activated protein kinase regulatory gamma subunit
METSHQAEPANSSPHLSASQQKPRNISTEQRTSFSRQQRPSQHSFLDRDREHSTGGWSASSIGTGMSGPTSSAHHRSMSKRLASGRPSILGGPTLKKRRDKHSLALLSIRDFLKGRSCYDGLPVSLRLVVLDTKLAVKPALDVMWQAGE